MTSASELKLEAREGVVVITLDRAATRNALTVELVTELADALAEQATAEGVAAVVLTGTPPVFCAGGDLANLSAVADQGALAVTDAIYSQFHRLVRTLGDIPQPVIAAVNGPAMGAGLDLALACDLRIASRDAVFASSWIAVGLVPGMGGATMLTRTVGAARASELVLTGRRITAEAALGWGLVNEVTDPEQVVERAVAVGSALAQLPAAAVSRSKAALRRAYDGDMGPERAALGAVQGSLLTSAEFAERTAKFR